MEKSSGINAANTNDKSPNNFDNNNSIAFRGVDGGSIDIGDGEDEETDGGNSEDGRSFNYAT